MKIKSTATASDLAAVTAGKTAKRNFYKKTQLSEEDTTLR